jgi:hypothetical protein
LYDIFLFGASYNTQFLLVLGLNKIKISGILDNCKEKQGKYFYGYDFVIYDPSIIIGKKCAVFVKNGYYSTENIKQLRNLNNQVVILE